MASALDVLRKEIRAAAGIHTRMVEARTEETRRRETGEDSYRTEIYGLWSQFQNQVKVIERVFEHVEEDELSKEQARLICRHLTGTDWMHTPDRELSETFRELSAL